MNSLSATGFSPNYPLIHCINRRRFCSRMPAVFSSLKSSTTPVEVDELIGDDVLQAFFRERKSDGDIIARICDELWLRGANANYRNFEEVADDENFNAQQAFEEGSEGGFLKLKKTSEWLMGDTDSAPMNKKMTMKEVADESERRKRLNFLRYEALKRELLLLTVAIGTACSGYCLVTLSVQAAVSYATGVLFSCLYFQLLCKQADNVSREMVPEIFRTKKAKKIGIRSEDLQDSLEKTLKGAGLALSSPRLVIPAAIYGLWELSQHFTHDIFDFQLVPAMVGLFAYKAAALVQVYRDNEDLQFIFPDSADGSSD
ncbi:uncharacterized protein LOC125186945 isoform X1 [Salvia hispanica]|uniref:uncharacterized protein LOC125186943 isoform X1 n=1 Tax=Salvia hispanica TaxID=49212 RepID=UPI002009BA28|nr:uncharacterized protein LOC125186943 isoform X1 [Salvia hispanica]XP_047939388.1 uncharacterized protein LOC125186945 isoform X1 [Salvia hispanica]